MRKKIKKYQKLILFVLEVFIFINFIKITATKAINCSELPNYNTSYSTCACYPACNAGDINYEPAPEGEGCPDETVCCCFGNIFPSDQQNQNPYALPEPIQSPTGVIPYEFETGIPGIVQKGQALQNMNLATFVKLLIIYIFRISGILAFVMIVYGGILYLISGGDSKKQAVAQKTISNAVIGLILLFGFWLILNTINPDILRAPKISIEGGNNGGNSGGNGDGGNGGGGNLNINQDTRDLAQKILSGTTHTTIEYRAAQRDLEDVINQNCTNPRLNSTNVGGNCIDDVQFPKCPSINKNLLKGLSGVMDKFEANYNQFSGCGKLKISPFISDHYYCKVPTSSHRFGCSVDLALKDKNCTQQLLQSLCNVGNDALDECKTGYICTFSLNGAALGIVNETNCKDVEPHLHLQAINCP